MFRSTGERHRHFHIRGSVVPYDPERHHRRTVRMQGFDYSSGGAYFVTVCTHNRACIFGEIVDGEMRLNDAGRAVRDEWLRTPSLRPHVQLDEYIVMPNHLHGILVLTEDEHGRPKTQQPRLDPSRDQQRGLQSPSQTIGAIIRGFKAATTRRIWDCTGIAHVPVWQGRYWEHVIRDDDDMDRIRAYIIANVERWLEDDNNPAHLTLR